MLDTKFYENAEKKFAFMYYHSDEKLLKFNVRVNNSLMEWQTIANGQLLEKVEKKTVHQHKVPSIAYRFYLIMIILGTVLDEIDLGRVQLILDEGFNEDNKELVEQKKAEVVEQIAQAQVKKERVS